MVEKSNDLVQKESKGSLQENVNGSFFIPDFIEMQQKSFFHFIEVGIIEEFQKLGPIFAKAGDIQILFYPTRYLFTPPEDTIKKAILRGKTYQAKLYVPAKVISKGGPEREVEWVLVGNIPLMTKRGHFIINGSPRVIVNQMVRSPGIYFHRRFVGARKREVYYADVIPFVGSWLRLQEREGEGLYAHLKRTPKIPYQLLYTSMEAFEKKISFRQGREEKETSSLLARYKARVALHLLHRFASNALRAAEFKKVTNNLALLREELEKPPSLTGAPRRKVTKKVVKQVLKKRRKNPTFQRQLDDISISSEIKAGSRYSVGEGELVDNIVREEVFLARMKKIRRRTKLLGKIIISLGLGGRKTPNWRKGSRLAPLVGMGNLAEVSDRFPNKGAREDILTEIVSLLFLRASPSTWQRGKIFIYEKFKNPFTYTLGGLGRSRIDTKLENQAVGCSFLSCDSTQLMARDLELASLYLAGVKRKKLLTDDIDHLKNRRVKTCGELLQNQFQVGLSRLKTLFRFKVSRGEQSISLKRVIDIKAVNGAWREFFGSNPLSQYMDQTNPLAEVTHKRRVSCLGPGGVSRDTAGMSMRGIHPSHYGRICPIETPEGKNAGLVNSLSVYTRIGSNGVLETPYYLVREGQIQRRGGFHFFSAQREEEEKATIAPGDVPFSRCNIIASSPLPVRRGENLLDNFSQATREQIQYIAISRIQMISIATSLIPFLEHNDANRALMGSNMQRQAVPLLTVEPPIVGTGLEGRVVAESGHILEARNAGRISYVSGRRIRVQRRGEQFQRREWAPQLGTDSVDRETDPRLFLSPLNKINKIAIAFGESEGESKEMVLPFLPPSAWHGIAPLFSRIASSINQFRFLTGSASFPRFNSLAFQRKKTTYSTIRSLLFLPRPKMCRRTSGGTPLVEDTYSLETYHQSNQKTPLRHRPWVKEGDWVQPGDLLADCSASQGGYLCLGRNVVIAYLPWDGYNFEDAVVVSDRLLSDDLYTSLHIERYEVYVEEMERDVVTITKWNPHLPDFEKGFLDKDGVVRVGRWIETGDLLVSKIMVIPPPPLSGYERLAYEILRKTPLKTRDVSFRLPKWVEGRVIDVKKRYYRERGRRPKLIFVRLHVMERKKIQVGDKVAGRHGNKGIVSTILPRQDMPYLSDGTTVDMVLNPLGVPSRMNVGQVFESLLGLAGGFLQQRFQITPFDEMYGAEASRSLVYLKLYQARLRTGYDWLFWPEFPGKMKLFDGRSGEAFDQPVTVGRAYMLKLIHMVDEKIHGRSRGPYSLITQQPVRGRGKGGGQRLGEMEVWALEGYGAAYTLQEILTTKSDDIENRRKVWQWIVQKPRHSSQKIPLGSSGGFKLVLRELQSLCLDIDIFQQRREKVSPIDITEEFKASVSSRSTKLPDPKVWEYPANILSFLRR